jgi:hypothetical protein
MDHPPTPISYGSVTACQLFSMTDRESFYLNSLRPQRDRLIDVMIVASSTQRCAAVIVVSGLGVPSHSVTTVWIACFSKKALVKFTRVAACTSSVPST